ncbi:MAG: amidohydrolase family protein [Planctomycetota bacterium]|nr:amidohydrolase family protein [Planctomycetota bacterium]
MIIDDHVHPLTRDARCIPNLSTVLERFFRPSARTGLAESISNRSLDDIITDMDAAGIDVSVIVGTDLTGSLGVVMVTNDSVAEMAAEYPRRLIGFAGVDPTTGVSAAVDELERAVRELGLKGLKLVPPVQKFSPADERYDRLWERATALGIPVWIHTGHQISTPGSVAKFGHPMLIDSLADRHPDLKIIMGHCSWPWPWEAWSVCCRRPNVYIDTAAYGSLFNHFPWDAFSKFDIEHKILFGTDYPLHGFTTSVEEVQSLAISDEFKEKILGLNAAAILGE